MEGALVAAAALWLNGKKPLLMDLRTTNKDTDHVVALFKVGGYWGAISKTNHAVLRYRDPIYKTLRELALSYFHEYFLSKDGTKTLREYSHAFDLSRLGSEWVATEKNLQSIANDLDYARHYPLLPHARRNKKTRLRKASKIEIQAGKLVEWATRHKGT